jgi:hypothetical protein
MSEMKILALVMLFAVAYAIQIEKEAQKYGLVKEVLKNDDNTLMKDEEEDNVEKLVKKFRILSLMSS